MIFKRNCDICGAEFTTNHKLKRYCSKECSKEAERIRKRKWKPKNKCAASEQKVSVTIDQMIEIALKLSKEQGRIIQYGDVQSMLLTGKLKVKDGVIAYGE